VLGYRRELVDFVRSARVPPFLNDVMNAEPFEGFSGTLAKHGRACRVLPLAPRAWPTRRRRSSNAR
jgi:hypothetical protein